MRRAGSLIAFLVAALLLGGPPGVMAQDSPAPPPPPAAPPPPATPQPPAPPGRGGPQKGPNVRVEVTIKDQQPSAPVVTKTVSVVVASGEQGRVRTMAEKREPGAHSPLFVDAYPWIEEHGRVVLRLALEYRNTGSMSKPIGAENTARSESETPPVQISVNESLTVVLEDGKPMLVTQSADPLTDRKVTVEVKATVLK